MIGDILEKEGFLVRLFSSAAEAQQEIFSISPELILLDLVLPDLNGFDFLRILRNDTRTGHVPIILLTSRSGTEDKVKGLELGADDYVTKPFDPEELAARVKSGVRRFKQEKAYNPLTGLPGNGLIEAELFSRLRQNKHFSVLYLDLDNFKAYNDRYGFLKGDEVIKLLADIIRRKLAAKGSPEDFLGHVGGDDFILIVSPERARELGEAVIQEFDGLVPLLYTAEDRKRGYMLSKDRDGKLKKYRLLSLSVAAVTEAQYKFEQPWELAEGAARVKEKVKQQPGSCYLEDNFANLGEDTETGGGG